jgi:hypothetical protein
VTEEGPRDHSAYAGEASIGADDQTRAMVRDLLETNELEETGSMYVEASEMQRTTAPEFMSMLSSYAVEVQQRGEFLIVAAWRAAGGYGSTVVSVRRKRSGETPRASDGLL